MNVTPIAAGAVVVSAAGYVAITYRRDLADARERLSQVDRRTTSTPHGVIEYCEWGEGTPLLLIHGVVGGCDVPPSWRALVPDRFKLITPSRFGYLGSALPENASVDGQVEMFVGLLDRLGIEKLPVLGFSAGSTSAALLALRHPNRVSGLILVCANAPHEKPVTVAPRIMAPIVFSQPTLWFLAKFLPSVLAAIAGKPKDYEPTDDDGKTLQAIFESFFPMRERSKGTIFDGYIGNPAVADIPFEEMTVPTLGVHAVDDPLAPYDDARSMAARIPGSRWIRVERGGHIFIHNDEHAVAAIRQFLDAVSPRDPASIGAVRESALVS